MNIRVKLILCEITVLCFVIRKLVKSLDRQIMFGLSENTTKKTGYAQICGESVHRIVATAFCGVAPSPQHIVDHIDTNRRNNRPENLRWITKLENILLNPITVKKIEYLCGSIEEFLKDPSKLRRNPVDKDFEWMRAVTKEEAAASLDRMLSWAKSDNPSFGGSLGEWVYRRSLPRKIIVPEKSSDVKKDSVAETPEPTINENHVQEKPKPKKSKSNPFDFPRPCDAEDTLIMYRTTGELVELLKSLLEVEKTIKLPDLILPTAGKAVQAVIDFLFAEVGVNRIEIAHAVKNPASGKVTQKCGLTYEGTKRKSFKTDDGEYLDVAYHSILRRE